MDWEEKDEGSNEEREEEGEERERGGGEREKVSGEEAALFIKGLSACISSSLQESA